MAQQSLLHAARGEDGKMERKSQRCNYCCTLSCTHAKTQFQEMGAAAFRSLYILLAPFNSIPFLQNEFVEVQLWKVLTVKSEIFWSLFFFQRLQKASLFGKFQKSCGLTDSISCAPFLHLPFLTLTEAFSPMCTYGTRLLHVCCVPVLEISTPDYSTVIPRSEPL